MAPDDMYQGTRLSAAEAIYSGMTTVHDWCHNIRSREYAERDIQALREAGIRARFSYGWSQGQDDKDILNIRDIEALHGDWKSHFNEGLITLELGWRGKFRAGPLPENVYRAELEAARSMGIPVTVHIQSRQNPHEIQGKGSLFERSNGADIVTPNEAVKICRPLASVNRAAADLRAARLAAAILHDFASTLTSSRYCIQL